MSDENIRSQANHLLELKPQAGPLMGDKKLKPRDQKSPRKIHKPWPIGSMYAIYGNIYHQYTPNVSIYIYTIHGYYGWVNPKNMSTKTSQNWMMGKF